MNINDMKNTELKDTLTDYVNEASTKFKKFYKLETECYYLVVTFLNERNEETTQVHEYSDPSRAIDALREWQDSAFIISRFLFAMQDNGELISIIEDLT